jgi:SAM-dependent methyltransferase
MHLMNTLGVEATQKRRCRTRKLELALMLPEGDVGTNSRMLDVGCGAAYQSSLLRSSGRNIISMDIANRAYYTNLNVLGDCTYLPFRDNCFDVIYCSHVLEHIQDRRKALLEMIRVANTDGYIYVVVPTLTWKMAQLLTFYPLWVSMKLKGGFGNAWEGTSFKRMPGAILRPNGSIYPKKKRTWTPPVHGAFRSNYEEMRAFRISRWLRLFRANGLNVSKVIRGPLFLPSEVPAPTINLRWLKICSSAIFVLTKQAKHA